MQSNIHPQWYPEAQVTCACGNAFTTGATQTTIEVDICSQCHPFFTGEMKFVDRQGRVDRFRVKQQSAGDISRGGKKARLEKKRAAQASEDTKTISSFKDILQDQRKTTKVA
jgi:large subunit ribosomal protein L31